MRCPYYDSEDTPNEYFDKCDPDCGGCPHFRECHNMYNDMNVADYSNNLFSRSTRERMHNKFPEFKDPQRQNKERLLNEDVINFTIDLQTLNIWEELNKYQSNKGR